MGFGLMILHLRVCLCLAELLLAEVGGPDFVEVLSQSHRHLTASGPAIPVKFAVGDER